MPDGQDRRSFLKHGVLALAGGALLPAIACAPARATAEPLKQGAAPRVTLHMGVPEIDISGRAKPYTAHSSPGSRIRTHGDWWML